MTLLIGRRQLLGAGAASMLAAPAILRAQPLFLRDPFVLGVAAGDPAPDGFVIWTRLIADADAPGGGMPMAAVEVEWSVAEDEGFRTIARSGTALARPELAHSVHVEVDGLQPGRPYFYRFQVGSARSFVGRAQTVPAAGAALDRVRFAVAGCQHFEDGLYTGYRHLAAEPDLDFVYHYGDYIYEYSSSPVRIAYGNLRERVREHRRPTELQSIDDYRLRYTEVKSDPNLMLAHAAAAWFITPDDHEVENNWVDGIPQDDVPPELFALRKRMALQAYYEHMPLRRAALALGADKPIYHRRQTYGSLMSAHFLDTRGSRTDQPCQDGFRPDCAGVDDPDAAVLGQVQERWLNEGLGASRARWNLIGQQIMVMPLDRRTGDEPEPIRNMDSWAAYTAPRERMLERFGRTGNVVVLTGDEHQNFAGQLRRDRGQGDPVGAEFVTTSMSSGGNGSDRRAFTDRLKARNPYLLDTNDQRGYALCEVTPQTFQTQWRVVDQVTTPGAPVRTRSTFVLEHGSPEIHGS
ncbi:alkaline phosphatase D [Sphingomonas jejuensis]|uniref:Alkaline phosphatase D n=1 Tax=Sphingomonas jejuensis TaxID=904715 RepID=A0ABX0XKF1_9SPHN|nr:alkaline phosphatase D family protein [Sphingomonas jejuensis]NJC33271.1 alkaline phosphatase D [Sphingomonas jejuensis]